MFRKRTLSGLAFSMGIAVAITKADDYFQGRKAKKLKRLRKDVEETSEVSIIIVGTEA